MNLKKLMQFNNPPGKIKNNMTTPHLKKSIGSSSSRLALLLIALVFACLGIRQSAQAGYIVTLQQVGPNVVATGSGAINLTGLTFSQSGSAKSRDKPSTALRRPCRVHLHGADFFQRRLLLRGQWTDEFRERCLRTSASSGSGDMVGIAAMTRGSTGSSQCSNGLCLRYCSIGQRDLQRHDSCNPRRNTGHLRMDVGNRSEPELHASDPCTAAAASNWASGRHHQSRNLDRKLFSHTERLGESARIDHQRVFSIWNNEQLRTHYRPAKSHREHLPKYQCAY